MTPSSLLVSGLCQSEPGAWVLQGTRDVQQLGTKIRWCLCLEHTYRQQHRQCLAG